MPRGAKAIDATTGHRTHREKESRKKAEAALLTGQKIIERPTVKADAAAHKEFLRLKPILEKIGKNDALYSASVNRYCEIYSEIELLKNSKKLFSDKLDMLDDEFEKLRDNGELEYDRISDYLSDIVKASNQLKSYDSMIMAKRKMMQDIEKENGWTVLSALRAIPKNIVEEDNDELIRLLKDEE